MLVEIVVDAIGMEDEDTCTCSTFWERVVETERRATLISTLQGTVSSPFILYLPKGYCQVEGVVRLPPACVVHHPPSHVSCIWCAHELMLITVENSGLIAQIEEGNRETAQLRAELTLTRQRVNELEERNVVNRDTLVATLEK